MDFVVKNTTKIGWLDVVCPYFCMGCGRLGAVICECCKNDIKRQGEAENEALRRKMAEGLMGIDGLWMVGGRKGLLEEMVKNYKYAPVRGVGRVLAEMMAEAIPGVRGSEGDAQFPVGGGGDEDDVQFSVGSGGGDVQFFVESGGDDVRFFAKSGKVRKSVRLSAEDKRREGDVRLPSKDKRSEDDVRFPAKDTRSENGAQLSAKDKSGKLFTDKGVKSELFSAGEAACAKNRYFPAGEVVVVPLPTIRKHVRERGFDHTLVLAKRLAKIRGWKCSKMLARANNTVQVGASAEERIGQAEGAYTARERAKMGVNYILVDDVWTTGASLRAAAGVLRGAGAERVYGVVVAVGV